MKYIEVGILHTNDMHSYMANYAKKKHLIDSIRQRNRESGIKTYLFDSGDLFSGSIYLNLYRGVKEIELLNSAKYDAFTIGNHEFDHGDELLSRLGDFADFSVVSSNVKYTNNYAALELVDIKEFIEYKIDNNYSFFITGLTTEDTLEVATPTENIAINPIKSSLMATIQKIKSINEFAPIVLLSHLGYDQDKTIAAEFPEINVILGAHTHTVLTQPTVINNTVIMQAGQYGKYIGDLIFRIYEDGKFEMMSYELVDVDATINEDSKILKVLDKMREDRNKKYSAVIANLPFRLNGERPIIAEGKSNLAQIVTEAYYQEGIKQGYNVIASLMNGFGIRASLEAGNIYYSDIVKVLPFTKSVMVIKIKGNDLVLGIKEGLHPQYYGLKLEEENYYLNNGEWILLDPETEYFVVTNTFIYSGKDNYNSINNAELVKDLGLDADILTNYLKTKFMNKE